MNKTTISALSAMILAVGLFNWLSYPIECKALPKSAEYSQAFKSHWTDGYAEITAYDLNIERYGESRQGSAVSIFVTEPFSNSAQTKADYGKHESSDVFDVMKLNLVQDFPTGLYDYNLMTSVFVALSDHSSVEAGSPAKIAFSAQEWCGMLFHELFFGKKKITQRQLSYFDGENSLSPNQDLSMKSGGLSEDSLFHWARGMASPQLAKGEATTLPFLRSLQHARLKHKQLKWTSAKLERASQSEMLKVSAGSFEVLLHTVVVKEGPTIRFWVEEAFPHRIIRWTSTDGVDAKMVGEKRMKYWELKGVKHESLLQDLGMKSRGPRRT